MASRRRWPLWTALLPLGLAVAAYGIAWSGWREMFYVELSRALPGQTATIAGFPYRMEATIARPWLVLEAPGVALRATGARAVVNRGPWRDDLHVVGVQSPRLSANAAGLAGASARIVAAEALASLRTDDGRLRRLSLTWREARVTLDLLPVPIGAATLELHLRPGVEPGNYEVVLNGEAVRVGGGAPLALAGTLAMTSGGSLEAWRRGGVAQIAPLTLGDASGEVLRFEGTITPAGEATRVAGVIATVCPATLRAAFAGAGAGRQAEAEKRTRRPVRIAVAGVSGRYALAAATLDEARLARRERLPACPRLG